MDSDQEDINISLDVVCMCMFYLLGNIHACCMSEVSRVIVFNIR